MTYSMLKIEFKEWDYECADKCCHDYGTSFIVNGKELTRYADNNVEEVVKLLLESLDIKYDIDA